MILASIGEGFVMAVWVLALIIFVLEINFTFESFNEVTALGCTPVFRDFNIEKWLESL